MKRRKLDTVNSMKILHVGWWIRPYRSGGLIIYAESLMQEQIKQGHEVYYFCGGRYNLFSNSVYTKRYKNNEINVIELVNSSNLIWDFKSIKYHINNPGTESEYEKILKEIKPDIIHIQELESLSANIINISSKYKIPVVMSLHNYWPVCPQRDLVDYEGKVCVDYMDGYKCMRCDVLPGSNKLQWMARGYLGIEPLPHKISRLVNYIYGRLNEFINNNHNSIPAEKHFTIRRMDFVKRLNNINLIAVSDKVKEIYCRYGVNRNNITTIRTSSLAIDFIKRKEKNVRDRPVSFGYIGSIQRIKGLHVLMEAFRYLDAEECTLNVYGDYNSEYGLRLVNENNIKNVHFHGRYKYQNLNEVLSNIDVGIVPPVWEDNAPQVVFEMLQGGIPVIGSDIGGIPDFVDDGVNGFLFRPGDSLDLMNKMKIILDNLQKIAQFSHNIRPHKTLSDHAKEILDYYIAITEKS